MEYVLTYFFIMTSVACMHACMRVCGREGGVQSRGGIVVEPQASDIHRVDRRPASTSNPYNYLGSIILSVCLFVIYEIIKAKL